MGIKTIESLTQKRKRPSQLSQIDIIITIGQKKIRAHKGKITIDKPIPQPIKPYPRDILTRHTIFLFGCPTGVNWRYR